MTALVNKGTLWTVNCGSNLGGAYTKACVGMILSNQPLKCVANQAVSIINHMIVTERLVNNFKSCKLRSAHLTGINIDQIK